MERYSVAFDFSADGESDTFTVRVYATSPDDAFEVAVKLCKDDYGDDIDDISNVTTKLILE